MPPAPRAAKITAKDVVTAVRRHFGAEKDGFGPEWAALEEFSLFPGAGTGRADLFLVRAWGGKPKGHERITIEVKVSRADLRSELAKPQKSEPFRAVSHRYYLATPAGLVKPEDDIPAEWGLLEIDETRGGLRCTVRRKGIRNDAPDAMSPSAFVEAFRRAGRSEARIREATAAIGDDPARVVAAERARDSAFKAEVRAKQTADRDKARLNDFLRAVASAGGWLCVCGKQVAKPGPHDNASYFRGQTHADGTSCGNDRWSRPQYDLDSLSRRLGVTDAEPETADPAELLARAKSMIGHALDRGLRQGLDPVDVLTGLEELLTRGAGA